MIVPLLCAALLAAAPDTSRAIAARDTLPGVVTLPEVRVTTSRAGDLTPVAHASLDRAEIVQRNIGLDTPMLLAQLPGAYAYSDAGNGIGYSYLSIRGFPQERISVLINGVPLNDPESNEVYWIDHPDLLASASDAQVQRGVGAALYGGPSVGGSVDVETGPFAERPQTSATLGYGSWDTKRLMVESNPGALPGGWQLYGRYSRIESFGYRDQSWSKLWSYALSARHPLGDNQWLRVNLYGGPELTHLAYLGVPREYLDGQITGNADQDRRFNPLTYPNERDHFFEPHYELIHTWALSAHALLAQTLYWFDGKGYYDEQRFGQSLTDYRLSPWATTDSTLYPRADYAQDGSGALVRDSLGRYTVERADIVRRRTIADRAYGWAPRLRLEHVGGAITLGGELRGHDGRHWGEVISGNGLPPGTPPDAKYYDFHPHTLSAGLYAREEWRPHGAWLVTGDLGWRHQGDVMAGDHFDNVSFDQRYDFALPRVGVTWSRAQKLTVFGSWSAARREPAFRDLYDGEGVGGAPLLVQGRPLIRPERVQDWELGARANPTAHEQLSANLFRMDFHDEIVYAGQFDTDLGYPILGNAAQSVHQGLELAATSQRPLAGALALDLDANATLSDNHFVRYREIDGTAPGDTVSFDGNKLGFFPSSIVNARALLALGGASVGAELQYAGRMFLDNTQSMLASIGPHTVTNLVAGWRGRVGGVPDLSVTARMTNAFDVRYATSGYMDYDAAGNLVPQFMPAATRGWFVQVRIGS
ncbi:MAG TPA: TonB-dependent receptor [Candidatus Eisenbacteria bacterium]|nr:TonB-dependent receptor [Candidatus Eisenbacteria bacterium]